MSSLYLTTHMYVITFMGLRARASSLQFRKYKNYLGYSEEQAQDSVTMGLITFCVWGRGVKWLFGFASCFDK